MMILHRIDYNGGDIWVAGDVDKNSLYFANQGVNSCMDVRENSDYPFLNHQGFYDSKHWIKNKIYGQSPSLSLPNIPYVEIEEDVEQLAIKASNKIVISKNGQPDKTLVSHWLNGYKTASAKKYTEEDLRKAFEAGAELDEFSEPAAGDMRPKWKDFYEYLESLQPKVVSIEVEMCSEEVHMNKGDGFKPYKIPVTYTKDGKTFVKVKKVNYES